MSFLLLNKTIVLGSGSPRRQDLLRELGIEFSVRKADIDEIYPLEMPKIEVAEFLAKEKSKAISIKQDELLITSDTVVVCKNEILEKPRDANHAIEMLLKLSGIEHSVFSGVCLRTHEKEISFSEETIVKFTALGLDQIKYYVETFKPFDKAGSYGIQEWIGLIGVEYIRGCYYNVMGFPTRKVHEALLKF